MQSHTITRNHTYRDSWLVHERLQREGDQLKRKVERLAPFGLERAQDHLMREAISMHSEALRGTQQAQDHLRLLLHPIPLDDDEGVRRAVGIRRDQL